MKRVQVFWSLVLVGFLIAAIPAGAQTKEDTITYAIQSDIWTWDPLNSVQRENIIFGYHVFDHLAARDPKTGQVGPSLATSWRALDDTTWEVKLRQGVRFHDGAPFTARDVKATFDRVLDPDKKLAGRGAHVRIKGVDVVDDHTVRFKTDGPYAIFVERLTALTMQSERQIREKGHDWIQEHPVGTGPYKLTRWARKQEQLFTRNEEYWGQKPAFKYVRVRVIPETATQIAELISGGVDIIKAVPPDQMDVINKSGQARIITSPILRTSYVALDQAARSGPNPFTDRRARLAANLAVDVDPIIKYVLSGLGDRVGTVINPMAFGYDASIKPYQQDIPRAKQLLAEAGHPNGIEVRFLEGPPIVEPGVIQTNDALLADLAKAGIRTKRQYIADDAIRVSMLTDGKAGPMWAGSWGYLSIFDADAILHPTFGCGQPFSYYCNKEVDELIKAGQSTIDPKKRMEIYAKAQRLMYDDAAAIFKWSLRGVWGVSNRVEYEPPRDEIDRMFLVSPRKK